MFQCKQYLHPGRYPALPKFARIVHPQKLHPRHQRNLLPEVSCHQAVTQLSQLLPQRPPAAEEPLAGGEPLRRGGRRAVQADRHQEHPAAAEAGQRGRDLGGDGRGHEAGAGPRPPIGRRLVQSEREAEVRPRSPAASGPGRGPRDPGRG